MLRVNPYGSVGLDSTTGGEVAARRGAATIGFGLHARLNERRWIVGKWLEMKRDSTLGLRSIARLQLLCMIVILLQLSACSRPSDEQQVRAAISEMQVAMESGEPADFMQHVADDFTGAEGQLDRRGLHNLLRGQVLTNARIGVTLASVDVELQENRATVKVTATLSGGNGRWIPERGAIYRIESGWRKQDGEWFCVNAQWERSL